MSIPPTQEPSATTAVTQSLTDGWRRMTTLLFTGPRASVKTWMQWGLIILISGVMSGGSGSLRWPGGDQGETPGLSDLGFKPPQIGPGLFSLIIGLVVVFVLVGLVWLYFQARFRLVLLDGVISGEPRIRGVFARTSEAGTGYFVFLLLTMFVILAALALALLPHIGTFRDLSQGSEPQLGQLLGILASVFLIVIPVVLVIGLADWFAYHLALPYVWLRGERFGTALRSAWELLKRRTGAVVLLLVLQFLFQIGLGIAGACVFCLACCLWIVPMAGIVGLAIWTTQVPVLMIVTIPVILALAAFVGWIQATLLAPIPIFFRAWSLAFVTGVDPSAMPRVEPPPAPGPPEPDPLAPPAPPAPPYSSGPLTDGGL